MPAPIQRDPDLWSLAEAATWLQISRQTAARLARAGQLPGAKKIGRRWDVSRIELQRHLHGTTETAELRRMLLDALEPDRRAS